jgi:hypothetical protein
MPKTWTWPEYREFTDAVDEITGSKHDSANKTVGDTFGEAEKEERKPMSADEQQRIEAARRKAEEERRRRVTDHDLFKVLCVELTRERPFRKLAIPEWELEWWEHRIGFTPETVAELAYPALSEKKLENRIQRFEEAAERLRTLADLLEERLEEEGTIRRLK